MPECLSFHVLTGGPGSGKTSIIERLAARGFVTVPETGRDFLRQQVAIGGRAVHWDDAVTFRELMLARGIADYERMQGETSPVFFDRGITELTGYCGLIGVPVPDHIRKAAEIYRYNPVVFVTPPWPEIYAHDALRKQDEDEAVRTYELACEAYSQSGYSIVEVPRLPVSDRVAFVLAKIDAEEPSA
jgi:predicted ATPase